MYLLVICMSFLEKYLLKLLPLFKVGTTEYNLSLKKKRRNHVIWNNMDEPEGYWKLYKVK